MGLIYVHLNRKRANALMDKYLPEKGGKALVGINPRNISKLVRMIYRTFIEILFKFNPSKFQKQSVADTVTRHSGSWMLNGCIKFVHEKGMLHFLIPHHWK